MDILNAIMAENLLATNQARIEALVGQAITNKTAAESQAIILARRCEMLEERIAELESQLETADGMIAADDRLIAELMQ